jgi:hypothetical protein
MNQQDLQHMVGAMVDERMRAVEKKYARMALGSGEGDRRLDCPGCTACLGLMDENREVSHGYQGHGSLFRPSGVFGLDCKRCNRMFFFSEDGEFTGARVRIPDRRHGEERGHLPD